MNKNDWIYQQTLHNVSQWDTSMENRYPETVKWNKNPHEYYIQLCEKCNYLESVKRITWDGYLTHNSKVLDLGCGGGWLSAYISTMQIVESIYAVDTSKNYLYNIMPTVVDIMGGISDKIIAIEGMFSPLLLEDKSLDIVVASAAVHHAENLELLLKEVRSKIKDGGYLMLLNETPSSNLRYIARLALAFSKILLKTIFQRYELVSPKISASGFEYDPYLGDKSYPMWYWEKAIDNAGFKIIEYIDTKLPTVKNMKQTSLKHFVCQAI